MPAIDLTRLKEQSSKLIGYFDQPDAFLHHLENLLEYYTNKTLRLNPVTLNTNLPSYKTPLPVMRQIESDLEKLGDQYPTSAVNLVIALWEANYFEARLLSAFLLGTLQPGSAMNLFTKLPDWLYETRDQAIKKALLTSALARLRRENPQVLLMLISEWLQAPGPKTQTWGLHAFIPLIQLLGYNDLPQFFQILRPAIETVSPTTQPDIQDCIITLYSISPSETIHFITEIIQHSGNQERMQEFSRLFRGFPPEIQKELDLVVKQIRIPSPKIKQD